MLRPGDVARDTEIRGLYAECGTRGVSLKLAVDVARGRTVRRTLGRWEHGAPIDLRSVRADAARLRAEIRAGQVPVTPARAAADAETAPTGLTVGAAVDRYLLEMPKDRCAEKTIRFTGARLRNHLAAWFDLPLVSITKDHCQAAHARITDDSGPVSANKVMRDFRAAWNLAARQSDDPGLEQRRCPVIAIKMNPESKRKNACMPVSALPSWWARVEALGNPLRAIMQKFGLLSGLRPGNLVGIRREWIQLDALGGPRICFPSKVMKGRGDKRRPFELPLSPPMVHLVRLALELGPSVVNAAPEHCATAGWLFPTRSRDGRSVIATSNWTEATLASNECGHALRHRYRTSATDAGVPADLAELLVAHRLAGVVGIYVDEGALFGRLLAEQCRVSSHILAACSATVPNPEKLSGSADLA